MKKKQKKLEGELQVLRAFIEARFAELKAELRKVVQQARGATAPAKKVARSRPANGHHDALVHALKVHKRGKDLAKAGKARDQLLRSLIPLYLARDLDGVEVNSGAISAFWKAQGIAYAGPNAAKALRAHVGYTLPAKHGKGWTISPNGVKYVEAALAKKIAA
jgi:hypothetical protein